MDLNQMLEIVDNKKKKLDTIRPFPSELVNNLHEWFRVELTYSSNALEGNTLSRSETATIIEKGLAVGGETIKEHIEALNHAEAFDYIVLLSQIPTSELQVSDIYTLHRLLLHHIDDEHAGILFPRYQREHPIYQPSPQPLKLMKLMDELIDWIHATSEHPVLIAANAHLRLIDNHPFIAANAQVARLLLNLLLLQKGYTFAVIKPEDKEKYDNAINQANVRHNKLPFYMLILEAVNESLEKYLA